MKKKTTGQKKKKIGPIIAVIILAAIIAGGIYYYNQQKISEANVQWQNVSGPFAINKFQYKIGENIFMVVSNLRPNDAGSIVIVDPKGDVYDSFQFNGTMKTDFHYYFKPNTQIGLKLCNPTDLVGKWGIIFQGVPYKPLKFNVTNYWIEGSQAEIEPIPDC
ncbi:MAG: hypothetical protein HY222_02680 [Thaumarchaeota archaeon]|nr:hypothetical protein [Nitrososphaerota archaeon]MBI3641280.1 hypothetical protein [Nitrososphaerota archaeon]